MITYKKKLFILIVVALLIIALIKSIPLFFDLLDNVPIISDPETETEIINPPEDTNTSETEFNNELDMLDDSNALSGTLFTNAPRENNIGEDCPGFIYCCASGALNRQSAYYYSGDDATFSKIIYHLSIDNEDKNIDYLEAWLTFYAGNDPENVHKVDATTHLSGNSLPITGSVTLPEGTTVIRVDGDGSEYDGLNMTVSELKAIKKQIN